MTDRTKALDELIAGDADLYDGVDSGFTPENIADAEWLVANMPGIRRFHDMPTYERALICHTAARFRAIASARITGDKDRRVSQSSAPTDDVALKPCPNPWCKGDPQTFHCPDQGTWQGYCAECGVEAPSKNTEAEAIAAWNQRATDAKIKALVEAVKPLALFHESGGHEGDGSDEALARVKSALAAFEGDV